MASEAFTEHGVRIAVEGCVCHSIVSPVARSLANKKYLGPWHAQRHLLVRPAIMPGQQLGRRRPGHHRG